MRKQRLEIGLIIILGVVIASAVTSTPLLGARQSSPSRSAAGADSSSAPVTLLPTNHPRLPAELSQLWYVPARTSVGDEVVAAMKMHANGQSAKALPTLSRAAAHQGPLGLYALYDMAVAQQGLGRIEEARRNFQAILDRQPIGFLNEAAALAEAECDEALRDPAAALAIYERLLLVKGVRADAMLMRIGAAAKAAGQPARAAEVYARVYYDFPLSEFAAAAGAELAALPVVPSIGPAGEPTERSRRELARADRLFQAKQYAAARTAFTALKMGAKGDERELVELRIAETNYFLKRFRDARDGLRPYLTGASRQGEALYFQAITLAELGDADGYKRTIRRVVDEFPKQSWAEEALNHLATYLIRKDEDDEADSVLRKLYALNPKGANAERAAWKVGWYTYLKGNYAEATRYFEGAAADFPRSDYRPAWLYWSGRAHEMLKESALAQARFELVTTDYMNSYYGRIAVTHLPGARTPPRLTAAPAAGRGAAGRGRGDAAVTGRAGGERGTTARGSADASGTVAEAIPAPPNATLITALATVGLYDDALNELRYAQRTWGDSSAIQATIAWVSRQLGLTKTGTERFNLVRGSITIMRRAYPQFMAAGGEQLPTEILSIIFPVEHWNLIQQHAAANGLDPYLMAALVCQESTFVPDIKSPVGAVGLSQLMTPTARQYAKKLKMPWSTRLLTNPDTNLRIGMAYFADLLKQYRSIHYVLAVYNAGDAPLKRWIAERPGYEAEEFIDDIPYPETQAYVKRLIGTAEDYRRLYQSR